MDPAPPLEGKKPNVAESKLTNKEARSSLRGSREQEREGTKQEKSEQDEHRKARSSAHIDWADPIQGKHATNHGFPNYPPRKAYSTHAESASHMGPPFPNYYGPTHTHPPSRQPPYENPRNFWNHNFMNETLYSTRRAPNSHGLSTGHQRTVQLPEPEPIENFTIHSHSHENSSRDASRRRTVASEHITSKKDTSSPASTKRKPKPDSSGLRNVENAAADHGRSDAKKTKKRKSKAPIDEDANSSVPRPQIAEPLEVEEVPTGDTDIQAQDGADTLKQQSVPAGNNSQEQQIQDAVNETFEGERKDGHVDLRTVTPFTTPPPAPSPPSPAASEVNLNNVAMNTVLGEGKLQEPEHGPEGGNLDWGGWEAMHMKKTNKKKKTIPSEEYGSPLITPHTQIIQTKQDSQPVPSKIHQARGGPEPIPTRVGIHTVTNKESALEQDVPNVVKRPMEGRAFEPTDAPLFAKHSDGTGASASSSMPFPYVSTPKTSQGYASMPSHQFSTSFNEETPEMMQPQSHVPYINQSLARDPRENYSPGKEGVQYFNSTAEKSDRPEAEPTTAEKLQNLERKVDAAMDAFTKQSSAVSAHAISTPTSWLGPTIEQEQAKLMMQWFQNMFELWQSGSSSRSQFTALASKNTEPDTPIPRGALEYFVEYDPIVLKLPESLTTHLPFREYHLPFPEYKRWEKVAEAIDRACLRLYRVAPGLSNKDFAFVGPERQIVHPETWPELVQPGWTIHMELRSRMSASSAIHNGLPSVEQPQNLQQVVTESSDESSDSDHEDITESEGGFASKPHYSRRNHSLHDGDDINSQVTASQPVQESGTTFVSQDPNEHAWATPDPIQRGIKAELGTPGGLQNEYRDDATSDQQYVSSEAQNQHITPEVNARDDMQSSPVYVRTGPTGEEDKVEDNIIKAQIKGRDDPKEATEGHFEIVESPGMKEESPKSTSTWNWMQSTLANIVPLGKRFPGPIRLTRRYSNPVEPTADRTDETKALRLRVERETHSDADDLKEEATFFDAREYKSPDLHTPRGGVMASHRTLDGHVLAADQAGPEEAHSASHSATAPIAITENDVNSKVNRYSQQGSSNERQRGPTAGNAQQRFVRPEQTSRLTSHRRVRATDPLVASTLKLTSRDKVSTPKLGLDWSGRGLHVKYEAESEVPLRVGQSLGGTLISRVDGCYLHGTSIHIARKTMRISPRLKLEDAMREVQNMEKLSHAHILQLIGSYSLGKTFSVLLYPVAKWNLEVFMDEIDAYPFTHPTKQALLKFPSCLLSSLHYIHKNHMKHMDIKPANILVNPVQGTSEGFMIYLADFGISRSYDSQDAMMTSSRCSFTKTYCAPEVADQQARNEKADIFSLGAVFSEMYTILAGCTLEDFSLHRSQARKDPDGCDSTDEDEDIDEEYMLENDFFYSKITAVKSWLRRLDVPELPGQLPWDDKDGLCEQLVAMMRSNHRRRPSALHLQKYFGKRDCCQQAPPAYDA